MTKKPHKPTMGRPQEFAAGRVTVRLTTSQLATAKKLGNGDASAGIRLALDRAEDKSEDSENGR